MNSGILLVMESFEAPIDAEALESDLRRLSNEIAELNLRSNSHSNSILNHF